MPKYETADYVKAEFRDERTSESECMWVRMEFCDDTDRLVLGRPDSVPDPDYGKNLRLRLQARRQLRQYPQRTHSPKGVSVDEYPSIRFDPTKHPLGGWRNRPAERSQVRLPDICRALDKDGYRACAQADRLATERSQFFA